MNDFALLEIELRFDAAHLLPKMPEGHKCRRLHGHSYGVFVVVRGPIDEELGWVMDYGDIKRVARPIVERLDHRYLNDIEGLENPTAENIARWLWQRLRAELPFLHEIRIKETCTSACVYRGGA